MGLSSANCASDLILKKEYEQLVQYNNGIYQIFYSLRIIDSKKFSVLKFSRICLHKVIIITSFLIVLINQANKQYLLDLNPRQLWFIAKLKGLVLDTYKPITAYNTISWSLYIVLWECHINQTRIHIVYYVSLNQIKSNQINSKNNTPFLGPMYAIRWLSIWLCLIHELVNKWITSLNI